MCNCKNTIGFNEKLAEAKQLTSDTGENYVVYTKEIPNHGKHVFIIKENDITDADEICCYFMLDETKKIYTSTNNIQVVDETIINLESLETEPGSETTAKPKTKKAKKSNEV